MLSGVNLEIIPLYACTLLDIKNCPPDTLTKLPKDKLIEILNEFSEILKFYNPLKIFKKKHLTFDRILSLFSLKSEKNGLEIFLKDNEAIFEIKNNLLDFTKKRLTTEVLAKNTLESFKG